jgi:hypothetical protein
LLHVHILHALLLPQTLPFNGFFIKKWLDADAARFRAEMPAQCISTGKTATASPLATLLELSFANELLLSGMKSFVALSIMLARKGFPAHCADERAFVGVGAKMRAKIVGTGETFRAQTTLEGRGVLLNSLGITTIRRCGLILWVRESQNVVSVW